MKRPAMALARAGIRAALVAAFFIIARLVHPAPVIAGEGPAAVRFPDTEAGRRAASYIEAFNSPSEIDLRAWLQTNVSPAGLAQRPVDQRMQTLTQVRRDLGAIVPVTIRSASEDVLAVIARGSTGQWVELGFQFEKDAPRLLLGVRFNLLDGPPDLDDAAAPLAQADLAGEISRLLEEFSAKDEFSGTVLVAKHSTSVFAGACGLASKEYGAPNRIDTRFNLGSINKLFTRIAIEQLVAAGKLSLDDRLGKWLPDYPNRDAAEKVTVRHLLEMTSGIGDFFGERYAATSKDRIRELRDYLPLFASEPLEFEPGTGNRYSNGGYVVLGLVVEAASGESYFDYVRSRICEPAGMRSTGHVMADVPEENVASGYTRNWDDREHPGEPRRNNIYTRPCRGSSAGGGYSTAGDLLKLVLALREARLGAIPAAREVSDAGIAVAGGAPGINAYLETRPAGGYTIIVLSNYDPPAAGKLGRAIGALIDRIK